MTDDRYRQFMSGEIDGANSEAESHVLAEYLARNPEAKAEFEELRRLDGDLKGLFAKAGEVEPPPALRPRLLALTPPEHQQSAAESAAPRTSRSLQFRFRPGYAVSFAIGLAAGLCIIFVADQFRPLTTTESSESLLGFMAPDSPDTPYLIDEEVPIDLADVATGKVRFRYRENTIILELDLTSGRDLSVTLAPGEGTVFKGCQQAGDGNQELNLRGSQTELIHRGACDYQFIFMSSQQSRATLHMELASAGNVLFAHSFPAAGTE